MKTKAPIVFLFLLVSCSSTPDRDYQVTHYQQTSIDLIRLADQKRQQEQYAEAIDLYLQAEAFALKRNDQRRIGLSKLKRALIGIIQNQAQQAATLIAEVERSNQIEKLGLEQAISFLQAKLLLQQGDKTQALTLLAQLEAHYQSDAERRAYYRLMRWSQDYAQLDADAVQQTVDGLTALYLARKLNNIEILSFAYFEQARWAAVQAGATQGQRIIEQSIDHFARLELTPKIAASLKFAADFYQRLGQEDRAAYYLAAYQAVDQAAAD